MNSGSKERLASGLPQNSPTPNPVAVEALDPVTAPSGPESDRYGPSYLDEMRALRERSWQLRADSVRLRLESRHHLAHLRSLRQHSANLAEVPLPQVEPMGGDEQSAAS